MSLFNYLLEASLALAVVGAVYYVLLRNESHYRFLRGFLLAGVIASLSIPFLHFSIQSDTISRLREAATVQQLPEIFIGVQPGNEMSSSHWLVSVIPYSYGSISFLFLSIFAYRCLRLFIWINKKEKSQYKNYTLIETNDNVSSFSFFKFILIGNANQFSPHEKEKIIKHELVHVTQFHSFDVVFIEVLTILFWFHPAVYYIRKSLKDVHEYEADHMTVDSEGRDEYIQLMARMALLSVGFSFANHFNQSQTLHRMSRLKSTIKNLNKTKIAGVAVMLVMFFIALACQDEWITNEKKSYPPAVQQAIGDFSNLYPNSKVIVLTDSRDVEVYFDDLREGNVLVQTLFVSRDNGEKDDYYIVVPNTRQRAAAFSPSNDVFTIVETPATPIFGMEKYYEQIAQLLRYPESARVSGKEGRVFVEFVINKDGNPADFKVLKGFDPECDAEALRVMMLSQRWNPAKQDGKIVRQRLVLPITFRLN